MKKIKFRWLANGKFNYREVKLPDDAQQMLYVDVNGVEVYNWDLVFSGETEYTFNAAIEIEDELSPDFISQNCYEYFHADGSRPDDYVEHEPLDLTQGI